MADLRIDRKNRMLLGVCAGLSNWSQIDVSVMRVLFILGFFLVGLGPVTYLVLFLIMLLIEKLGTV